MGFPGKPSIRTSICESDQNGRILNSDHSGRNYRLLQFRHPKGVRQVNLLTDLRIGETATLVSLELPESVQNYLMHMGFVPDALVTALRRAPAGDPTVYGIDGMEIALRHETAEAIRIRHTTDTSRDESDAELEELAAELPERKAEIHEFAGAAR
jgi:Fe2+ transport system protein FeoA